MKKIIYLLTISLFPLISLSQNLEWAAKIGGSYYDNSYDITHDNAGNIYLTGGFCNSANFNPLGTPFYLNSSNADNSDIFIAKYDPNFNLIWAISIGNSEWEVGLSIEVDSSNNVYVSGNFKGNIDFDPGLGNYFLYSQEMSYFLAKYNSVGQLEWVKDIGSDGYDFLHVPSRTRLFIDNNENVFSFLHENDTLKSFNITGNLLWQKHISGLPILIGKSRFAYIENFKIPFEYNYFYQDTVRLCLFDIDNSNQNSYLIAQTNDGFLGGFISEGHDGEIIVCGKFWGSISFNGLNDTTITISNYDSTMNNFGGYGPLEKEFIAKIDTSGNTIWVKNNLEPNPYPHILKTNAFGDIFTAKSLIAKYDSNFNLLAYSTLSSGIGYDFIGGIELYDDTAIICGYFSHFIDVDLTNSNYLLTCSPPQDIFIAKYSNFDITTNPFSVNEMTNKGNKVSVYPNPSTGLYYLEFNETNHNSVLIVYDMYGRELLSTKVDRGSYTLDISGYINGIYLLNIIQEREKTSFKIVKQD